LQLQPMQSPAWVNRVEMAAFILMRLYTYFINRERKFTNKLIKNNKLAIACQ
jgi:hypothetical protein